MLLLAISPGALRKQDRNRHLGEGRVTAGDRSTSRNVSTDGSLTWAVTEGTDGRGTILPCCLEVMVGSLRISLPAQLAGEEKTPLSPGLLSQCYIQPTTLSESNQDSHILLYPGKDPRSPSIPLPSPMKPHNTVGPNLTRKISKEGVEGSGILRPGSSKWAPGRAPRAAPVSVLGMQTLRPHPRPPESESTF